MWRSIWKGEPILPSIYSANLPAGFQLLCRIKLAVVALLYIAAQQSSKAKYPEALGDQEQQHCPEQVPHAWSWSSNPSAAPQTVSVCIPLALPVPGLVFVFSSLEEGKWGKETIYECGSLFAIFFVSLFSLFAVCPVSVFSCCIQNKRVSWPHSSGPSALRFMQRRKNRLLLIKKLFRILEFILMCSRIC